MPAPPNVPTGRTSRARATARSTASRRGLGRNGRGPRGGEGALGGASVVLDGVARERGDGVEAVRGGLRLVASALRLDLRSPRVARQVLDLLVLVLHLPRLLLDPARQHPGLGVRAVELDVGVRRPRVGGGAMHPDHADEHALGVRRAVQSLANRATALAVAIHNHRDENRTFGVRSGGGGGRRGFAFG